MISSDNAVLIDGEEGTCAGAVGNLSNSDGGDGAGGHRVSAIFACDAVHAAKSEVTVAASVGGPVTPT